MSDQVAIDERIHQLVEAHREELAQLVDQALERELAQLVEERIAATNGDVEHEVREARQEPVVTSADVTKTCVGACGRTLPASAFEARRLKCRECRRAEERERARRRTAEPEPEPDRPGNPNSFRAAELIAPGANKSEPVAIAIPELLERSRPDTRPAADGLVGWLVREGLAVKVDDALAPTAKGRELGAGIA